MEGRKMRIGSVSNNIIKSRCSNGTNQKGGSAFSRRSSENVKKLVMINRKVTWTKSATNQFEKIIDYIRQDSEQMQIKQKKKYLRKSINYQIIG